MTAPNMAAITASLKNFSLSDAGDEADRSDMPGNQQDVEPSLELNSNISLPYHWEQCLDLKTGEIYYVNWNDGSKAREDPRKIVNFDGDYYSEEDSSDDGHGSSSASSPSPRDDYGYVDHVLVVAGCKSCLMYFMLPKRVVECPKCNGFLLHFDRPEEEEEENEKGNGGCL